MATQSNFLYTLPEGAEAKIGLKEIGHVFYLRKKMNGSKEFVALRNINLEVKKREFVALVGPSGCGKSTLLDVLSGLTQPTTGTVYVDGHKVTGPALDRGIVLQGYALFPWRTIRKNVEFGLEIKKVPKKEWHEISTHFIDLVGLHGFEEHYPHELSGGMAQRVAIARVLACDSEALLMDEPFAAVDAQTRETLQDELLRIWEETKKTIVFVTHSIEEAVFLADRVVILTASPGTVREIVPIDLPRPRQNSNIRTSAEFGWIRHRIWGLLQNQIVSGQRPLNSAPAGEVLPSSAAL